MTNTDIILIIGGVVLLVAFIYSYIVYPPDPQEYNMVDKVMFSSDKTCWETPQSFFDELDKEFGFVLE